MNETQIPAWADGESWDFFKSNFYGGGWAKHKTAGVTVYGNGSLCVGDWNYNFQTPEDARYIANCLIAGKVRPR